jgi:hypothetical protein
MPGRDKIAAASPTGIPVFIMLFHVVPDFLGMTKHLAAWTEKKVFGDHIASPVMRARLRSVALLS